MVFENVFFVSRDVDDTWSIILDVPEIAPCFPGAKLTEKIDNNTYKGTVNVKLGPVALSFNGTAIIKEQDDIHHRMTVEASGADSKGRGTAKAEARFSLSPEKDGTLVKVQTDLNMSGSVAQFARGVSLIQSVSTSLIKEFENRLNQQLARQIPANLTTPAPIPFTSEKAMPKSDNDIGIGFLFQVLRDWIISLCRRAER